MVQIINTKPGLSELFGTGLGTGLGNSLNQLANLKTNQYAQQQQRQQMLPALKSLFGAEKGAQYANLDQELLKPLITEQVKSSHRLEETGPGLKEIAPELTEEQARNIARTPPGVQQLWYRNYLQSPKAAIESLNKLSDNASTKDITDFAKQNYQELNNPQEQELAPQAAEYNQKEAKFRPEKPKTVADYMKSGVTKDEAKDLVKYDRKRIDQTQKDTKSYYDSTLAFEEAADMSDLRLNKLENLVKKGNLPIAAFYKVFDKLENDIGVTAGATVGGIIGGLAGGGLGTAGGPAGTIAGQLAGRGFGAAIGGGIGSLIGPIGSLLKSAQTFTSPDTEEFQKLSTDFIREAKNIFGSRITDNDLKTFLSLVPSLSQTDHGKLAIIKNMKMFNKASKIKAKNMKKIIHENGGRRPENLQILVNDRSKNELDKLAKEFEAV